VEKTVRFAARSLHDVEVGAGGEVIAAGSDGVIVLTNGELAPSTIVGLPGERDLEIAIVQ
jgi:hypothetical protein